MIDTHEGLSDLCVAALEATDHVFAVATPDRPSLVNLGRYLGVLERLGMTADNVSVVLNKAEAETGLDPLDMAVELGRRFEAMVPYSREVPLSINVGVPLVVGKPKSPITELLTTALSVVLPGSRKPEPVRLAPAPATTPALPAPEVRAAEPAPTPPAPVGPGPVAPVAPVDPVDPVVVDDVPPALGEPVEIDLSDLPSRPCSVIARARPRRCRRSTEPAVARTGRAPPRPARGSRVPPRQMTPLVLLTSPLTAGK